MAEHSEGDQSYTSDQHLRGVSGADLVLDEVILDLCLQFEVEGAHRRENWMISVILNFTHVVLLKEKRSFDGMVRFEQLRSISSSIQNDCVITTRMLWDPLSDVVYFAPHSHPAIITDIVFLKLTPSDLFSLY